MCVGCVGFVSNHYLAQRIEQYKAKYACRTRIWRLWSRIGKRLQEILFLTIPGSAMISLGMGDVLPEKMLCRLPIFWEGGVFLLRHRCHLHFNGLRQFFVFFFAPVVGSNYFGLGRPIPRFV